MKKPSREELRKLLLADLKPKNKMLRETVERFSGLQNSCIEVAKSAMRDYNNKHHQA